MVNSAISNAKRDFSATSMISSIFVLKSDAGYAFYDTGNELYREMYRQDYINSVTPPPGVLKESPYTPSSNQRSISPSLLGQIAGARARNSYHPSNQKKPSVSQSSTPSKKELRKKYLLMSLGEYKPGEVDQRLCMAPPTIEEEVRALYSFKVSDSALKRLCEAQFITNYRTSHYRAFIARLDKIEDAVGSKDATALITAYAKELEAIAPKVFQEREAWLGRPLNGDIIVWQKGLKSCADRGWHYDPQIFKNAIDAIYRHVEHIGREETLYECIKPGIGATHVNLVNLGFKHDLNKSLVNFTNWLNNYKGKIPCQFG